MKKIYTRAIVKRLGLIKPQFLFALFVIQFLAFNCGVFAFAQSAKMDNPETEYAKAKDLYQKNDYQNANIVYEQLIKDGNIAPQIYYNLGNCYYKTGNNSKAIVNYERALKLLPDDEDIIFNLKVAQMKIADKIEPVPDIFYKRWMNYAATSLSANAWTRIFIICFWFIFAAAAVYIFAKSMFAKKAGFVSILIFMFFSCATFVLARQSHIVSDLQQNAIITSASVYVKSSPDEKGNDLFIVHEGTKVEILDELNNWKKVRIANGSIGWLKVNDIEQI